MNLIEFDEDAGGDGEMRTSLSMDNCALWGEEEEEEECQVFFSNQEYYWRLEELKKTHLRNMAELEKMYIGRSNGGHQRLPHDLGLGSGENRPAEEQATPTRRLQRINSQEELDFRETSIGSDQSELSGGQDSAGELELYMDCLAGIPSTDKTCGRERRKKEARIVAALGNLSPKEESSCTFKARPLPCSVYGGPRQRGGQSPEVKTSTSPPGSPSATSVAHAPDRGERSWISGRCSVNKPVKKHMEVSIEMVKDRQWSYVRPHL
ncbi:hypothetical protein N1851_008338 [Merluccius polli]|uniref:Uncharacterized protein n=1 Tax=Merluccius polli TaxID=89951 RepID=A0AA47P4J3_MERPO|nr:hypothetical protein N1851_008338 [Merluccius polli]